MRNYYNFFYRTIVTRMARHHTRLTPEQLALLPEGHETIKQKLQMYDTALHENQVFFDAVLMNMNEEPSSHTRKNFYQNVKQQPDDARHDQWHVPTHHANKLSGILHAVSRDWSSEGEQERQEAYAPLLNALMQSGLPIGSTVLVPGSGMGRLACEAAGRGFKAQGNDFDYFMLFTADLLLNGCPEAQMLRVHPWVHHLCNQMSHTDATRCVNVPDVSASAILNSGDPIIESKRDFSMCAGEFLLAYEVDDQGSNLGTWDALMSCFFIDTAPNILEYILRIRNMLRPGGLWINMGPLTYHWADTFSELATDAMSNSNGGGLDSRYHESLELSWEEVRGAIMNAGFVIEREERQSCHYTLDQKSMIRTQYQCVFFQARKRESEKQQAITSV
uniref:carnosine N-methyltransferase n=1 Tax=Octactis speculum TaxID=3111310 RepID=A0A7S2BJU0_9STRA